jgi:hypothetical protein
MTVRVHAFTLAPYCPNSTQEPQADDYFVVEHPVAVPPTQQNTLTPQESNDSFYGMSGDSTPVAGMPEPIAEPSSMPAAPLFPEPSPFPRDSGLARYDYNKSPGLPSPPKASLIAEAVFPTRPDSSDTLDLLREPPRKEEHAQGTYDPLLGTYMSPMSTTGSITGGPVYASPPEFRYASPPDFPYADTPATLENSVSPLNNSLLQTPLDNPLLHTPSPHYDMDPTPLSGALMHPMPQDRSSRTASRTASRTTSRSTTTGSPSPRTELLTPTPTPGPAPSVGTATMYTHPSFDSRTSSSRSSASRPTSESFSERERDRERRHESRRQKERERAHRHSEERRHNEELRHEEERQQDEARRHNEGHRHSERQYNERRHDEHRRTEQQPGEHQHRHKKHSHKDSQSRTNLVSLIMEEETRVAQSRHALAVAQAQLAAESRRAGESEATALRTMQALRDAVDTRASAERERNRVVEELALYRAQHTLALAEIARAQDILDKAEEARAEAVETATRAKEKARRMRDEHAVTKAREQGRKEGFREGVQWGRRVGLEEGKSHEHEDGARRAPAIQLHSSEEGPETIQEEDESLEDDNDGASLLERRGPPSILYQPAPRERRMHQFAPSRGTHEHQGVPRETHGGGGTFSPVGATRPNMHASQAAAMLAGAGYMPAAHAAMDEEDEEEEGRKTPRQYRIPPDNLIPIAGPDGRITMPPPNEMSGAPSAVGSALSVEDGAAVRRPFSASSNAASTTLGMTGFTGVTGVTGVSRAPAPRVRDFSGYAAVPVPNGARHDGRLSIIPEVGSSMEVTPVPLPRPIPVPGAPDEYFSEQDEPEEEAYTPPPAPSQEPPTRQRARNVLTRIANKLGGGLSRKNDPPTFRDMPDDEGGWVDINGRSMPTPTTDAPPGPARLTKHQRTASENVSQVSCSWSNADSSLTPVAWEPCTCCSHQGRYRVL